METKNKIKITGKCNFCNKISNLLKSKDHTGEMRYTCGCLCLCGIPKNECDKHR